MWQSLSLLLDVFLFMFKYSLNTLLPYFPKAFFQGYFLRRGNLFSFLFFLSVDAYTYLETQKAEERKEVSALHALDTSGEDQRPVVATA